ncbi:unnamed protein product [Mytilus coruscus]|uniref:Uncharacterized protein n=1 Tax=Mytilus coruscus TaxID=42192 RepID=A0A6J8DLV8_MYTCO|nr:unnamed protein product [Mytilus coruscus]
MMVAFVTYLAELYADLYFVNENNDLNNDMNQVQLMESLIKENVLKEMYDAYKGIKFEESVLQFMRENLSSVPHHSDFRKDIELEFSDIDEKLWDLCNWFYTTAQREHWKQFLTPAKAANLCIHSYVNSHDERVSRETLKSKAAASGKEYMDGENKENINESPMAGTPSPNLFMTTSKDTIHILKILQVLNWYLKKSLGKENTNVEEKDCDT